MIPIPAPFEGVAMHVMEAPGVGGITANLHRAAERRPRLSSVVRLAFEVCLFAAQLVPKRSGGRRPRAASVLPLRFGGQAKLPIRGHDARLPAEFGEFRTVRLRFGKVDVPKRKVISVRQLYC